jgi:signal transduction histidine kinase
MLKDNNLKRFQYKITNIVNLFLIIGIICFFISYIIIFYINRQINIEEYKQNVTNTSKNLQYNMSSQLIVIANNSDFINYLRSGEITRLKDIYKIKWLFSDLNPKNLVHGLVIYNNATKTIIFKSGSNTKYYTKLNLCYLNNQVNLNLGSCDYSIMLYFNELEYLHQLQKINPDIQITQRFQKNNYYFNPFSELFGEFKSTNFSTVKIGSYITYKFPFFILFSLFITILIFILLLIYSYNFIKKSIDKKFIQPINYIIEGLTQNINLTQHSDMLNEFNTLINVVNQYHNQQVHQRLNKIVARVVHDIKSPLSVIELSSAELLDNNHPKRLIIKNALRSIKAIVTNMLLTYAGKLNMYSEFDTIKSYILVNDCVEEVIEQKHVEWSNNAGKFILDYNKCNELNNNWGFLSAIEFKRHISNLLNNSFEALNGESIYIKIEVSIINDFIYITIIDNGVGIEKSFITNMQFMKSSKESGSGIGLISAINYFIAEGGMFEINPLQSGGTKVEIYLKLQPPPQWFPSIVEIKQNLVIVDDNTSILDYWVNKLHGIQVNIITFSSPYKFQEWYKKIQEDSNFTFFIDYDYNEDVTGIDLLYMITCKEDCYLITSSYSDFKIQEFVQNMQIKMIPKCMLNKIGLYFKNNTNIGE